MRFLLTVQRKMENELIEINEIMIIFVAITTNGINLFQT